MLVPWWRHPAQGSATDRVCCWGMRESDIELSSLGGTWNIELGTETCQTRTADGAGKIHSVCPFCVTCVQERYQINNAFLTDAYCLPFKSLPIAGGL